MKIVAFVVGLSLLGCGDDGHGALPDAPRADADIDAPNDTPPGMAKITVTDSGTPVVGAHVYFLNPDNSVAANTDTDSNGVAEAVVTAGGSVTVIDPFNVRTGAPSKQLQTIVGVKPGDQLVMKRTSNSNSASMDVQLPADAAGTSFGVDTTCGSSSFGAAARGSVFLYDCTTTDALGTRVDANGARKWVYQPNVSVVADALIDLSAQTYAATVTTTSTYSNVPSSSNGATLSRYLFTPRGRLYQCDGGLHTETSFTATLACPNPAGTTLVDVLAVNRASAQHYLYEATTGGDRTVDLTGVLLKEFTSSPEIVAATSSIDFTQTTAGATADFTKATVIGQTPVYYSWTIITPATTQVVFPTLPGADAIYNVSTASAIGVQQMFEYKVPGGYDAIRAHVFDGEPGVAIGAAGRALVVAPGRAI